MGAGGTRTCGCGHAEMWHRGRCRIQRCECVEFKWATHGQAHQPTVATPLADSRPSRARLHDRNAHKRYGP